MRSERIGRQLHVLGKIYLENHILHYSSYIHVFDLQVWRDFLMLCVSFIIQPCLQLERLSENKRASLTSRYPDMRLEMGELLYDMWDTLGASGQLIHCSSEVY